MYVDRRPLDGHFQKGKHEQRYDWEEEMELSRYGACEDSQELSPRILGIN